MPDIPANVVPVVPVVPAAINIATGIKGFILWIGGSLGGITAVLYACGYLVTRAHLHMLGLYGFVKFDSDHYLQEGAKFFLSVAYDLAEIAVSFFAVIGLLLVPAVIASFIGKRRLEQWVQRFAAWRALRRSVQAPRIARSLFYGVLFAVLIWATSYNLYPAYAPLCISDLLYGAGGSNECSANLDLSQLAATLQAALLSGNAALLDVTFGERLSQTIYLALLAALAWHTVSPWRPRGWLIAPFLISMGLFLLLLPMDYGVLKRPTVYPVLSIASDKAAAPQATGTLYLLDRTDNEFVAWDAAAHKVMWIPASTLARAEIVRMHDLFGTATSAASRPGGNR